MTDHSYSKQQIVLLYIIVFLCIICTSSVLGEILYITNVEILMIAISAIFIFSSKRQTQPSNNRLKIYIIVLVFVSIVQLIIYPEKFFHLCRFFLLILILSKVSFIAINSNLNIFKCIYYLVLYISIISTSIYILVELLNITLPHSAFEKEELPTYSNYFYVYYSTVTQWNYETLLGITFKRNNGIFTEPGLFSTFLIFAIAIYMFILKKRINFSYCV